MMAADVYDEGCLHTRCCCVYDNSVYTQPSYTLWLYTLGIRRNILDVVHVNDSSQCLSSCSFSSDLHAVIRFIFYAPSYVFTNAHATMFFA